MNVFCLFTESLLYIYDIEIMALGRPFHRKNIIFLYNQPRDMANLMSLLSVEKFYRHQSTRILKAEDIFLKFRCIFVYLFLRLELEPQHLWKLRSPKTYTEIRLFSSWHTKSFRLYFSSDFFQISNY